MELPEERGWTWTWGDGGHQTRGLFGATDKVVGSGTVTVRSEKGRAFVVPGLLSRCLGLSSLAAKEMHSFVNGLVSKPLLLLVLFP